MAVNEGLSVWVVDAASTAKSGETPFLWTVCWAPANSYFMWAAGPGHHPGRLFCSSVGAVTVSAVPVAWNCSSIWSHPHPKKNHSFILHQFEFLDSEHLHRNLKCRDGIFFGHQNALCLCPLTTYGTDPVEFKIIPPSQCCSKAVLRCVFTRRLAVVSGWGSFIVVRSTAGCTIGPLKAFCECIIPDTERRKRLISINGFSPQEMLINCFLQNQTENFISSTGHKNP